MAREKCAICNKEIEKGFMDKIIGTVVKIKNNDTKQTFLVCNTCQKEYKDSIKDKLMPL
jgi:uncharacterized protein with PIN domain